MSLDDARPARFHMARNDEIVADGVIFPDGSVAVRWRGRHRSTVSWESLSDAVAIHNQHGDTAIHMLDPMPPDVTDARLA